MIKSFIIRFSLEGSIKLGPFCLRQLRKMTVSESLVLLLQVNCLGELTGQGSFDKGLGRPK